MNKPGNARTTVERTSRWRQWPAENGIKIALISPGREIRLHDLMPRGFDSRMIGTVTCIENNLNPPNGTAGGVGFRSQA